MTRARRSLDDVNRRAWRTRASQRSFGTAVGWSDPGEQAVTEWAADRFSGPPILDLGVGGGRTVPLLTAVSDDYIGIDYTPELVAIARERFPGVDLRVGDARDLSAFGDATLGLVVFSFNGIDAVDVDGRGQVLAEIRRVLRDDGLAVVSTHNRHGPGHRENLRSTLDAGPGASWRARLVGLVRSALHLPNNLVNRARNAPLQQPGDDVSVRVAAAHNFGIVIVYTSLAEQIRQFAAAGLAVDAVFANTGQRLDPDETDTDDVFWFHFAVRRRLGPEPAVVHAGAQ